jgi:hypothetical protein
MKHTLPLITVLFATSYLFAQAPASTETQSASAPESPLSSAPVSPVISSKHSDGSTHTARSKAPSDIFPHWSVVGEWRVTHPYWTDLLTLRVDGTLVTSRQGTTGRWVLTADAGTPLLVIRWDAYGTESLAMITQDHFRGQTTRGRFSDMRRGVEQSAPIKPARSRGKKSS